MKIFVFAFLFIIFGLALTGEYFLAMDYYPQGCCHDVGSFLILALMIGTAILFTSGVIKVILL